MRDQRGEPTGANVRLPFKAAHHPVLPGFHMKMATRESIRSEKDRYSPRRLNLAESEYCSDRPDNPPLKLNASMTGH